MTVLTIGMATYHDWEGVWQTVIALRNEVVSSGLQDRVELLCVDNEPDGTHAPHVRHVVEQAGGRYVRHDGPNSTAQPRNALFAQATGEWVLVIDSHVFLRQGVLARLVEWCRDHTDPDLYHGPLLGESITLADGQPALVWTHWSPTWGPDGMLGQMQCNHQAVASGDAWKIAASGMGLFLSHRSHWLGFHSEATGFGGEECTIHHRYRALGRSVWCLPWLQWVHRFRPQGMSIPYPNLWTDRARNYLLTARDWGYPLIKDIHAAHVQPGRLTEAEWSDLLRRLSIDPQRMHETGVIHPSVADVAQTSTHIPPDDLVQLLEVLESREKTAERQLPCEGRGPTLGAVLCRTCGGGSLPVALRQCVKHDRHVTLYPQRDEVASCVACVQSGQHVPPQRVQHHPVTGGTR